MWNKIKEWTLLLALILMIVAIMILDWKFAVFMWKVKFVIGLFGTVGLFVYWLILHYML